MQRFFCVCLSNDMHNCISGSYLSTLPVINRRKMPVHIGAVVKRYLKKEKDLGPSAIAVDLQTTRQNIANQLDKVDPNMTLIRRLSERYHVDLFQVISQALKESKEISVAVGEPVSGYGPVTRSAYEALLQENIDLHRELREKTKEIERLRRQLQAAGIKE